jgi:hypothetical protein
MTESGERAAVREQNRSLLRRVGVLDEAGGAHRSDPLRDPAAFRELAGRLHRLIDRPYDVVVVRDLFGDRVLGYELSLLAGCPVAVSYDREGLIELELDATDRRLALIAADTHFTRESIQAAAMGLRQAGLEVTGAAVLLEQLQTTYAFPVWSLERVPD